MNTVRSPLAPASNVKLLETYSVKGLVNEWKKSFDIDITNELKGLENIFLYGCEESQLDFFLPTSAVGTSHLYHELQKFDWFYMPHKWEFDEAIKDLSNCKSLLEVGCGQGYFIEDVIKELRCSVKGTEFNEDAVKKARHKNLPVEKVDLAELLARGETFDAVCSFQVLEHVTEPRGFIQAMIKVLKPNGILILSVPNKDSFLKYQYNILDMPPHHMTRWNLAAFKYLEKLFPLKMTRACYEPLAKYHIYGYISAYAHYLYTKLPFSKFILSERSIGAFATIIEKTRLNRFLRGQSLYVRYQKL